MMTPVHPRPDRLKGDDRAPIANQDMYLLDFVNHVRGAQSYEGLEQLPAPGADGSSPLELAMGCRLETGLMRLSSPQAAAAVSDVTGLPVGVDRMTIALPPALAPLAEALDAARSRQRGAMGNS